MKKYLTERSMCIRNSEWTTPEKWFELYKQFQKQEEWLVDISRFNQKELSFHMEEIKGFQLSNNDEMEKFSIIERRHIMKEVISIWGKIQTFSVDDGNIFYHTDFCIHNLMYDIEKKIVRLIDPDSFQILWARKYPAIYHGPFIDLSLIHI